MRYLLDTSTAVALIRDEPPRVRARFEQEVHGGSVVAIGTVALFELWYGVTRSTRSRLNGERLRLFLAGPVDVLEFDGESAAAAGALRAELAAAGTPIGPYDVLVAAQALRSEATLLTGNGAEFGRVPGLAWEDWRSPHA